MAQALCELQLELENGSSLPSVVEEAVTVFGSPKVETKDFIPNTPATKESRKKHKSSGFSTKFKKKLEFEGDGNACLDGKSCQKSKDLIAVNESFLGSSNEKKYFADLGIGNFPSPKELANLDESFLAKRCKLGYRASRIVKLAQAIVDGRIQLTKIEELSKQASLLSYNQLTEYLKEIEGFGSFTCANVLMCLGYYHVIPTDSETIRHLKQVIVYYISCFFLSI